MRWRMGSDKPEFDKNASLDSLRYVVLDTELTSLDQRTNRLLSVGALAMNGSSIRIGEQFYRVVNPQVPIPAEGVVIHKLRSEDVGRGGPLAATLRELSEFLKDAVLVGHFADVDVRVLRKEMALTGHTLTNPSVCTARTHRWILGQGLYSEDLPMQMEKLDLPTLAEFYGIVAPDLHHALTDAFLTALLWQRMLHRLRANGVEGLGKLMKIAGI